MIKINLLPPELIGKKKPAKISVRPTPSFMVIALLIPIYLITFFVVYKFYSTRTRSNKEIRDLKTKLEKKKKQKSEQEKKYKNLRETYSLLQNQVEILRALDPPNRLLWSEKLNMLAELIPKGVYLTSIKLTETVEQIETAESKRRQAEWKSVPKEKKGEKPEIIKRPVIRQTLTLDGITYAEKGGAGERLELIVRFHTALRNFQWQNHRGETRRFIDHFDPKITFKDIRNAKISNVEVSKFTFILITKPFSAEVSPSQKPKPPEKAPIASASKPSEQRKEVK